MVECRSLCLTLGWTGNGHWDGTDCLVMMWRQNVVASESLFMNLVAFYKAILSCYIQASTPSKHCMFIFHCPDNVQVISHVSHMYRKAPHC
jgi:hypothetical protein